MIIRIVIFVVIFGSDFNRREDFLLTSPVPVVKVLLDVEGRVCLTVMRFTLYNFINYGYICGGGLYIQGNFDGTFWES